LDFWTAFWGVDLTVKFPHQLIGSNWPWIQKPTTHIDGKRRLTAHGRYGPTILVFCPCWDKSSRMWFNKSRHTYLRPLFTSTGELRIYELNWEIGILEIGIQNYFLQEKYQRDTDI
jgi:hypothetical protein